LVVCKSETTLANLDHDSIIGPFRIDRRFCDVFRRTRQATQSNDPTTAASRLSALPPPEVVDILLAARLVWWQHHHVQVLQQESPSTAVNAAHCRCFLVISVLVLVSSFLSPSWWRCFALLSPLPKLMEPSLPVRLLHHVLFRVCHAFLTPPSSHLSHRCGAVFRRNNVKSANTTCGSFNTSVHRKSSTAWHSYTDVFIDNNTRQAAVLRSDRTAADIPEKQAADDQKSCGAASHGWWCRL
jgi:hypothetical protein